MLALLKLACSAVLRGMGCARHRVVRGTLSDSAPVGRQKQAEEQKSGLHYIEEQQY